MTLLIILAILVSCALWLVISLTIYFIPVIVAVWALIESILILVSSKGSNFHKDAQGLELLD